MDEIRIKAFENSVIDLCNGAAISNRVKYYVLKDIAEKLLDASEKDYQVQVATLDMQKAIGRKEQQKDVQQDSHKA